MKRKMCREEINREIMDEISKSEMRKKRKKNKMNRKRKLK